MDRDSGNLTYIHSVESLWSPEGEKFQREKYIPKIELLKKHLRRPIGEARLLDVGVGYGFFLQLVEKDYGVKDIFGMDPFPDSIEIASRHTSARIERGDINDDKWPFDSRSFDIITSFDVVEHLVDPSAFFRKAGDYLGDGGLVLVTTPNRQLPYLMRSLPWFGLPDRNTTHINVRRPAYWKRLATQNGFRILEAWKGEHLTHTRVFPRLLRNICSAARLDHRKIPLVNSFEQSFCMILTPAGSPPAGDQPERQGQ